MTEAVQSSTSLSSADEPAKISGPAKRAAALTITAAAAEQIKTLLSEQDGAVALRLGVGTKGCSGHSYEISYASELKPWDEVVETNGAKVAIEATALMFVIGATMDYQEDRLQSGFVFSNPNETGRCGCGESFHFGDSTEAA